MAKKKTAKKKSVKKDAAVDVLPGMPGAFVVMGLGTKKNAELAKAIRKKLGGE